MSDWSSSLLRKQLALCFSTKSTCPTPGLTSKSQNSLSFALLHSHSDIQVKLRGVHSRHFPNFGTSRFASSECRPPECFNQYLKSAWTRYIGLRAKWRELNESEDLVGHLCLVLGKIPGLQNIKYETIACPEFRYTPVELLKVYEPDFACSGPVCKLYDEFSDMEPISGCLRSASRALRALMIALSTTKICINRFIAECSPSQLAISCHAFDTSQARAPNFGEIFMCLIKLRLTLTNYDYETRTSHMTLLTPREMSPKA